ncbi:MAG: WD40/YVTN/BNR-like repeat-containing protein [Actinomycetota bacterium]
MLRRGLVASATVVVVLAAMWPAAPDALGETEHGQDWFAEQRSYPSGVIPGGALTAARLAADRLPAVAMALAWSPLGPRSTTFGGDDDFSGEPPVAGRVTSIAPSPTDPGTAYIGAAGGGVWKTTDGGVSWTPLFDDQPVLAVGAVAVIPGADPGSDVVLAGTGEANGSRDSSYGLGLFRSADGGSSWSGVAGSLFEGCRFARLSVDPSDPMVILAAVRGGPTLAPSECGADREGIYRSADQGLTWARVLPGPASDVAPDTARPGSWYAAVAGSGVAASGDGGVHWNAVPGLPGDLGRVQLAVAGKRLFVLASRGFGPPAVWVATTGAPGWDPIELPPDFCRRGGSAPQCDYDMALAVDPSHPSRVFAGGIDLYGIPDIDAADPSARALGVADGGIHVDVHSLVFGPGPTGGHVLWVGTDGGVYRTVGGRSFRNLNGDLAITQFYPGTSGGLVGPLLGGTQDNGTQVHVDDRVWTRVFGGDGGYSAVNPDHPRTIYATLPGAFVFKSRDGGATWRNVFANEGEHREPAEFIAPFVMHPSIPSRLYVGTDRVYQSDDAGLTWRPISPAFGSQPGQDCCVSAIAPAPSDPLVVYAGMAAGGGLEVSVDGGTTWRDTGPNGLPDRFVTDMAVDPARPEHAVASVSGFGTGHLFETIDGGAHWLDVSGDLPDVPVNTVAFDPRPSPPTLFAGTDVGVFTAPDSGPGTGWSRYGTGLPNAVVTDLNLDLATSQLIAATHGRSMFEIPVPAPGSPVTYPLVAVSRGSGTIRSGDAGGPIDCGETCSVNLAPGSTETLEAEPATGFVFGGWLRCRSEEGEQCTAVVEGPTYVTAVFTDPSDPVTTLTAPHAELQLRRLFRVAWTATDEGSGVATSEVRARTASYDRRLPGYRNGFRVGGLERTSFLWSASEGSTTCFEVRAIDRAGNQGRWSEQKCTAAPVDDRSLEGRGWTHVHDARLFRGTALRSGTRGAELALPFVAARRLVLLAERCPRCGRVQVRWRGRVLGSFDLRAPRFHRRARIALVDLASVRKGPLTIRVVSRGRPVTIDGLAVMKVPAPVASGPS